MESILIRPKDKAELKLIKEVLQKMKISVEILPDTYTPNALTLKTIDDAHRGKGVGEPIENIKDFISSL